MSRQWRELCEQRPDLYLYEPSEDDLRAMQPELEQWLTDEQAQREYQSWLEVLDQQHGR